MSADKAGLPAQNGVRFLDAGDSALIVEFGDKVDRALSKRVVAFERALGRADLPGVTETLATFRSVLVNYNPDRLARAQLIASAEKLLDEGATSETSARAWRLPVCYDGDLAPDLRLVADQTGLKPDQVIERHAASDYHVYMIGFSPGQPYMGSPDQSLALPRQSEPRLKVPAGSVAMAMAMTTIYSLTSPGGWHLIGHCPVRLFDLAWQKPALLAAGDKVVFEPVSKSEHELITGEIAAGNYRPEMAEL
jgi:KipI family sensor histidine kinase inhibitor